MTERRSSWTSVAVAVCVLGLAAAAGGASAQAELGGVCDSASAPLECRLAAASAQVIQPRVALALWGGNPVPGTASTVGLRLASTPRIAASAGLLVVPTTLPPLLDRPATGSRTGLVTGLTLQSSVGLAHGLSPVPTVGGLLSVDVIGRLSVARLPTSKGFDDGSVWGLAAGLRLGILRESLTLPGLSLTASYGRSGTVTYGDPSLATTQGLMRGAVSRLSATAAASRNLFGLRLAGGVSWDRHASDVTLHWDGALPGPEGNVGARAVMNRWSGFGSISWSRLIYHAALEAGVQETPTLDTLPAGVGLDPIGWWLGLSVRVTP